MKKKIFMLTIGVMMCLTLVGCEKQTDYKLDSMPKEVKKLGKYDELEVDRLDDGENKDLVTQEITSVILDNHIYNKKKKNVSLNDWISVGVQFVDGENVYGDFNNREDYYVGGTDIVEGFNKGLISAEINRKENFKVTFDKNFEDEELAGKTCDCIAFVYGVYVTPKELEDEDVRNLNSESYHSVEELEVYAEEKVENDIIRQNKELQFQDVINQIAEQSEMTGFQSQEFDSEYQEVIKELKKEAEEEGKSYGEFMSECIGVNDDEIDSYITETTYQRLEKKVILKAIAYSEKITVSKEEAEKYATETLGYASLEEYLRKEDVLLEELEDNILVLKAYEYVLSIVKVK